MSGRNRLFCLALGGWLLAGLPFLCPTDVASQEQQDDTAAEESADQQEGSTATKQEVPQEVISPSEPIGTGSTDLVGGEDSTSNTQTENDYRQADLEAQQDMARWALWMVIVSALSVGIATVAVVLVYRTLREAKRTTEAAIAASTSAEESVGVTRETAQLELRAYLSAEPAGINQLIGRDEGMGHVFVRNVGKLPARNVRVEVLMKISDGREADFPTSSDDETVNRVIQPSAGMGQGSRHIFPVEDLCVAGKFVFVWGVAYYDDGYECRRVTRFCHRYAAASHDREVIRPSRMPKTLTIIDADKARYHTEGNDAD